MGKKLFLYLVSVKSVRGVALFSAFGKTEVRKCGGRFKLLGVHLVLVLMHCTVCTSSQVCKTYPGNGDLQ